ncbi:MAG: SDR family oxidoreductase [Gemmataceae bacterium]
MSRLQGKVAFITGGGSGIGLAAARALSAEGATVVIAGRNEEKLAKAIQENTGQPGCEKLSYLKLDVSDAAKVQTAIQKVTKKHGQIDILVNNAGTNLKERLCRELTIEGWDKLIRINLDGAFYCLHAVLPQMLERKDGIIVNICSTAGKRATPLGGTAYSASKFGMAAMGLCLAIEEKDSNIRVTNIYPGEVDTPILENRPNPVSDEHRSTILQPEDVGAAVAFVCTMPPRANIPELIIKPTTQAYS